MVFSNSFTMGLSWRNSGTIRQKDVSSNIVPTKFFVLLSFPESYTQTLRKEPMTKKDIFESFDGFLLDAVYDALDFFAEQQDASQKWILIILKMSEHTTFDRLL